MRKIVSIIYLLALTFLLGCVAGEGGKKKADCATGQVFDSVSRSCKGAIVLPDAPTPQTKTVSVLEDSGLNLIKLEYKDGENDFATDCHVSSGSSVGYIKQLDIQSIRIYSNNDIVDPSQTYITINSTLAAVPSVAPNLLIPGQRGIDIYLPTAGPTTSSTISSLINSDPTIRTWVQAAPLANQVMTPVSGQFPLNEVECGCSGGVCTAAITPVVDYHGTTEFTYNLTDKDGTSVSQRVRLNITSVNDPPNVANIPGRVINATEKYDHDLSSVVSAQGNLVSDIFVTGIGVVQAVITADDANDGDPSFNNLTFQLVSPPAYGTIFIDPFGNYTYNTYEEVAADSFSVRAVDSEGGMSDPVTIAINITNVDDPPVGTLTSISDFDENTSAGIITLTYTDEEDAENDSATRCAITAANKVYPDGGCSCDGSGVCRAIITALPNQTGSASFSYKIYDASIEEPQSTTVNFAINPVSNNPVTFPSVAGTNFIQGLESPTYVPDSYDFTLNGAVDEDGDPITAYTLVSGPANGTIEGCLGSGASGLSCTYTPNDGNLADSTTLDGNPGGGSDLARVSLGAFGTLYAKTLGTSYNGFSIEVKNIRNSDESINTLYSASALAFTQGPGKVVFIVQSGMTTPAHISAAISANPSVEKLISFEEGAGVISGAEIGGHVLGGGVATVDQFTFRATDMTGASTDQIVHISLIPVPDRPTICEYSSYAETQVCGLNGCIGNFSPHTIIPDKDDLTFYSSLTGSCFKSSAGEWQPVESHIASRTINELDPIVIDNIKVDEGGGPSEDPESLTITNIDSSDENLVPLGNIEVFYNGVSVSRGTGATTPFALVGSGPVSADSLGLRVVIIPQTINPANNEKSSELEITVQDSTGRSTEVNFTVKVQKVSATHGGWISFGATGPKVDSLGLVNEDRLVCPYSLDLCEGGKSCTGASSPVNNGNADPDNADAIYMQDNGSSMSCFRQKRTQLQNIAFIGKTSAPVAINYDPNLATNINVSGTTINIKVIDDVTTTDSIISWIRSNPSANALVKAINLKPGEDQDSPATATVGALGNSNWESFQTYCNATPAALEPSCGVAGVDSCIGTQSPIGSIAPTKSDSRYWDEQANVCYRSTGTTVNSWETYDAPAEVTLSWNQFSVNGSASISEYQVFRRLSNEEFDYSKPINRNKIPGSAQTYTFVDNAQNSVVPPAPGTVYHYVIRPVVNGILTSTAAETGTNAVGIVRIMAPPKNMAFAHRWMINKRVCSQMNRSSDPTGNYRCLYKGPGDVDILGVHYYDFGRDLLVDRFEAGCPYSPAPACPGTFDNSCIGVSNPNGNITPSGAHKVYYSRSEGKCFYNSIGGNNNWVEWNNLSPAQRAAYFANYEPDTVNLDINNPQFDSNNDKQYHRSSLPPLTNIGQANANLFCSGLENIRHEELLGIKSDLAHRLPGRKDQIAYSLWDADNLNDSVIAVTETGLSLNSSSKCNSSGASGLENGYVDFDKPDSNDFYSLPGTSASGIRSLATGSNETSSCTSAFGVQDAIGNVSEWTSHGLNCPLLSQCFSNESLVIQGVELVRKRPATSGLAIGVLFLSGGLGQEVDVISSGATRVIRVDLSQLATNDADNVSSAINNYVQASNLVTARVVGNGSDTMAPFGLSAFMGIEVTGTDDTAMSSSDTTDDYGYWSLDGLRGPCVDSDSDILCDANISSWAIEDERFSAGRFLTPMGLPAHVSSLSNFTTDYDLFEIGPTSGITSLSLHDDTVTFNSRVIASELTGCGGLSAGGSYLSGNGSGVWNLEALPCSDAFGVLTLQDITYRAMDAQDLNYTIRYIDDPGVNAPVSMSGNTVIIDLQELGAPTPTQIVAAVNSFVLGGVEPGLNIQAFVSGDPFALQAPFAGPVPFEDLQSEAVSKRVDVGFRCVLEVPYPDTPGAGSSAYDE